jgi:hypothetical protein
MARAFSIALSGMGVVIAVVVAYVSASLSNYNELTGSNALTWPFFLAGLVIGGIVCEMGRMAGNLNRRAIFYAEIAMVIASSAVYVAQQNLSESFSAQMFGVLIDRHAEACRYNEVMTKFNCEIGDIFVLSLRNDGDFFL